MITVKYEDIRSVTDEYEAQVHNYSGRGMYGKCCLGISFDSLSEFVRFVSELARNVAEDDFAGWDNPLREFNNEISEVSSDGFGYRTIYYWSGVELDGYEDS